MASLDDLKKRISSVKSTQKITKAMKMVAAAKLRRAQESAERGRPYSEKMNNIILNLSSGVSDKENAPKLLSGTGDDKVHLCVVLTADRGLCGGFNSNIIKKAKSYFQKISDTGKTLKVVKEIYPKAHFATVYAKPKGTEMVDTYITEVSQDTWIFFPWDMALQYVAPYSGND